MEIKTILIPVDGSEPAENAFRYGVGLAEENGATIVLLHVLDANETYYATNRVMLAGGMLDERKETAQRVMDQKKIGGRGIKKRPQKRSLEILFI